MRISLLSATLLVLSYDAAAAQFWDWGESGPRYRRYDDRYSRGSPWDYDRPRPPSRYQTWNFPWDDPYDRRGYNEAPGVLSGGARPDIAPIGPDRVPFPSEYAPGTIVIETHGRQLFLVTSDREALRYPISVGRDGFTWNGTEKISRIAEWPDWHPPAEMRERDQSLPEKMTGGIKNPLGAKALYLGNTLYRIHGTNDAKTIGQAASSGCFRMLNGHVIDLADRVQVGTPVTVIERLPADVARALPPTRLPRNNAEEARARRW
jgi:lipoprotein-anchoring transpeptidase ErfK/SrfK